MPELISSPSIIEAAGTKSKRIEEFVGCINTGHDNISVALMNSPQGWVEPGQRPDFEEITVVLHGMLRVEHETGVLDVRAGQEVLCRPGEWIRYSTPENGGAQYIAICLPAFTMDTVNRDPE